MSEQSDDGDNIYVINIKYCLESKLSASAIGGVHNCIQSAKREVTDIWDRSLREDPSMCRWTPEPQLHEKGNQHQPVYSSSFFARGDDGLLTLVAGIEIYCRTLKSGHPLEVLSEQAE